MLFGLQSFAQSADKKEIHRIIDVYSKCVIEKDSATFYDLFNDGRVTWCAAIKGGDYFEGSYKGFMRGLYKYKHSEDKFDKIHIVEDGTVASVTMDYSFWAEGKMTNWGGKYLTLIKRDGKWKITSVIYSLELVK